MSESQLMTGVLGVGSLGRQHAWKLGEHGEVALVGLFDPDPERAQRVAKETSCRAFPSADALLAEVDAVIVAAPTEQHRELGERALNIGVHTLVEKPLASSLEEADRLLRAAERASRVLHVGHLTRFHAGIRLLSQLGFSQHPPRYMEASRLNTFQPRSLDIDVILDLMVHDLDLLQHWSRAPITEVRALGIPVVTDKVDMANARIVLANGAVANITASRVARKRVREIRLFQPPHYASLDLIGGTMTAYERDPSSPAGAIPGVRGEQIELPANDLLAEEVDAFVQACRGRASSGVGGSEGRAALALGLAVREAIEEHFAHFGSPESLAKGRP